MGSVKAALVYTVGYRRSCVWEGVLYEYKMKTKVDFLARKSAILLNGKLFLFYSIGLGVFQG